MALGIEKFLGDAAVEVVQCTTNNTQGVLTNIFEIFRLSQLSDAVGRIPEDGDGASRVVVNEEKNITLDAIVAPPRDGEVVSVSSNWIGSGSPSRATRAAK